MMSSRDAKELADAARSLAEEGDLDRTVRKILELVTAKTQADDSGVVLLDAEQRLEAVGATATAAAQADQWQETLREGPGVSATRTHRSYLVRDTARDVRWPRWGPIIADLGFTSALSTCLYTKRRTVGILNLYSASSRGLAEEDAEYAQVLASHAAIAIDSVQEEDGLRRAIETRNVIGQAQGLLMERYELNANQAFEVLRRYALDTGIKLREAAERLVATRDLPGQR